MLATAQAPTPPDAPSPSLADLSRRASVISTSSSDDATTSEQAPVTPQRPRPIRTFTGPRSNSPMPSTPRGSRPPTYLTRDLGLSDDPPLSPLSPPTARSSSRAASRTRGVCIDDFETHGELGEGAYSTVMLATYRRTKHKYAIKTLDKGHLIRHQKMNTALVERAALVRLTSIGHPGIVRLAYTFHDQWSLYFVIDWAQKGELQSAISRLGSLSLVCSRFYAAQIVDAVRFMHDQGVIHRDLKPENVLLDEHFRVKIADFGTAVVLNSDLEPEKFAGTAQYIAPEIIVNNESSRSSDLWSFGCIVYQMLAGRFAFAGLSNYLIMEKVKKVEYTFPEGFDEEAEEFVRRLLVRDPTQRLGAGSDSTSDMKALMCHPFLSSIKWDELWNGSVPALEPGLLKKEHPLATVKDRNWEAIDALWDEMASGPDASDDIEWAPEANGNGQHAAPVMPQPSGQNAAAVDVGPMGEIRPIFIDHSLDRRTTSGSRTPTRTPQAPANRSVESLAANVPVNVNGVIQSLQSLKLQHEHEEAERGRKHAMTPVQGNGPPVDFGSLLRLPPDEPLLYTSTVEVSSLRRRASKLLRPLASPQVKPKIRQLILTKRRIFVVKYQPRHPHDVNVKVEYLIQPEKDNATRVLLSIEHKGEREFVLMTGSKSASYAAPDADVAATWVRKINDLLVRT